MSRIAPTIPVDLNSRRVLVDDLATRVVRCDCCPGGLCESCEPSELGAMEFGGMTFRNRSDWHVRSSFGSLGACRVSNTPFSSGPFGGDVPLIRHTEGAQFEAGDLPGGGTAQAHWTWSPTIVLESPTLLFPENVVRFVLWLDVVAFTDGRVAYVIGLNAETSDRARPDQITTLLFFEDGALPDFASPCEPDVFPISISLRQEGFALELVAGGFVDA